MRVRQVHTIRAMEGQGRKGTVGATPHEAAERTLLHIPIIHSQADMGGLSESIQRMKIRRLGRTGWERTVNRIEELWVQIEQVIDSLALAYERVRLYQDGLPVCGREVEIVTELARAGSRNHRLLLRLREKGATMTGAESAELLVEEYQLVQEDFASSWRGVTVREEARRKALRDSLLKRRDQFIGRRISDTLLKEETGIIFLGMLHSLRPWLDKDIRVIFPIHRPLDRGAREG